MRNKWKYINAGDKSEHGIVSKVDGRRLVLWDSPKEHLKASQTQCGGRERAQGAYPSPHSELSLEFLGTQWTVDMN